METYNANDLRSWENLFETIPVGFWRSAPPSKAMEACLDFFNQHNVKTVLDVGCGVGRWAVYLAKHGLQVKGTDFSERAIEIARKWALDERLNIEFTRRTLTEPAYPHEKFQGVVAALILDNVSPGEMLTGIEQIRESLDDDGCLFALFNPVRTDEVTETQIECENPTAGITQINYTDEEITSTFSGFNVLDIQTFEAQMRGFFLKS